MRNMILCAIKVEKKLEKILSIWQPCEVIYQLSLILREDPTFIAAILFRLFEPEGPGFKLTSPASRSQIASLKYGRVGVSGSDLLLKHEFESPS